MLGTAGTDVARLLTIIEIKGGYGFDKLFSRHKALVCSKILSRSQKIIRSALLNEFAVTFCETMKDKLTAEELKTNEQLVLQDKINEMNPDLPPTSLTMSYDMGWQRRSGGRLYDSLSDHGFLIGCRTKSWSFWCS